MKHQFKNNKKKLPILYLTIPFLYLASCREVTNSEIEKIDFHKKSTQLVPNVDNFCADTEVNAKAQNLVRWILGQSIDKADEKNIEKYKQAMYQHLVDLMYSRLVFEKYPQFGKLPKPITSKQQLLSLLPNACQNHLDRYNPRSKYQSLTNKAIENVIDKYLDTKTNIHYFFDSYYKTENVGISQNSCISREINLQGLSSSELAKTLGEALGYLCEDPARVEIYLRNPIAIASLIEEKSKTDKNAVENAKIGYCAFSKIKTQEEANYDKMYRSELFWVLPLGVLGTSATFVGALAGALSTALPTGGSSLFLVPAVGVSLELGLFAATWGPRYIRLSEKLDYLNGLKRMQKLGLPSECNIKQLKTTIDELENYMLGDWIGLFIGGTIAAFLPPGGTIVHVSLRELFIAGLIALNPVKLISTTRKSISIEGLKKINDFKNLIVQKNLSLFTDPNRLYLKGQITAAYTQKIMLGVLLGIFGSLGWTAAYDEINGIKIAIEDLNDFRTDADLSIDLSKIGMEPIIITDIVSKIDGYNEEFKNLLIQSANSDVLKSILSQDVLLKLKAKAESNSNIVSRIFSGFINKLVGHQSIFKKLPSTTDIVRFKSAISGTTYTGHAVETFRGGVHVIFLYEPIYNSQLVKMRIFPAADIDRDSAEILSKECEQKFSHTDSNEAISNAEEQKFLNKVEKVFANAPSNSEDRQQPQPINVKVEISGQSYDGILWYMSPMDVSLEVNDTPDMRNILFINFPKDQPPIDLDDQKDALIMLDDFKQSSTLNIVEQKFECLVN
ncbi:MAG: hypothetical protein R3B45_12980 [Bdellovibrionota bacterium]